MYLKTLLYVVYTLAVFSSALPVEKEINKRVCGLVLMPTTQIQLWENDPDTSYPNTASTDKSVMLYQDVSINGGTQTVTNKRTSLIGFTGPVSSPTYPVYGCSLGITFPSSYKFSPYTGGGQHSISVYSVSSPLPSAPTYNNIVLGSLFGSFNPLDVVGNSVVINSKTCPTAAEGGLAFVFKFAEEIVTPASIGWDEYINELNGQGLRGVFLSYNC